MIEEIIIPSTVTSIGASAFYGCSGLEKITIPESVTTIGNGAFEGCSGLTELTLPFVGSALLYSTGQYATLGIMFGTTSTTIGFRNNIRVCRSFA